MPDQALFRRSDNPRQRIDGAGAGNIQSFSHVLADFGAEVIKVEAPGRGDDLRAGKVHGVSSYWKVYARNKKSVTPDFRQKRGRELLLIVTLLFRSASEDQLA